MSSPSSTAAPLATRATQPSPLDPRDCLGNIFLFTHEHQLAMEIVLRHLKTDDEQELIDFVRANILGRVFYIQGDNTWVVCLYGRKQRADGVAVQRFRREDLSAQVKACRDFVPACLGEDHGPHWISWVTSLSCYHEYMSIRMGGPKKRLMGVSISPQPNPAPDAVYLVIAAPPIHTPRFTNLVTEEDYDHYVRHVLSLKIPGTNVAAIRWFVSFMYWVRFDGDIPSFISYMVMMVCGLHPVGWAPCKLFVLSGPQGSGKSETLNHFASFLNPINYAETSAETLTGKTFNDSLIKPKLCCHEAGRNWYKISSAFLRSIVTDVTALHEFEVKYGPLHKFVGAIMICICADCKSESMDGADERRFLNMVVCKDPKNIADYHPFHLSVRLNARLFIQANESLSVFREQFRQVFVDYIGIYFDLVCPTGIKVPKLFDRKDSFYDKGNDEAKAAIKTSGGAPPSKRAKTSAASVSSNLVSVVNALADNVAQNASIFPINCPTVFYNLFHTNLAIFNEKDSTQLKNNVLFHCWKSTWTTDRSIYSFEVEPGKIEKFDETLCVIYDQWKTEEEAPEISQTKEDKALRRSIAFRRMLAKFKACIMVRASFDFDPALPAWPRSLYSSVALWIIGLWVNFKSNNNRLIENGNNWGETGVDYERLHPVARLLMQRLSGKDNFSGGKHVSLNEELLRTSLRINLQFFLGPGRNILELRPMVLNWGPFSILRNLIAIGGPEYRPTEEQIEMIVRRHGGERMIIDKNREDYEILVCSTKRHLMDQLYQILNSPDGLLAVEDEARVFILLYADLFSTGPLGIMDKKEFYGTLDTIDAAVVSPKVPVGFRRAFGLRRNPEALGEVARTDFTLEQPVEKTTKQESQERESHAEQQSLFRFEKQAQRAEPLVEFEVNVEPIPTPVQLSDDHEVYSYADQASQQTQDF